MNSNGSSRHAGSEKRRQVMAYLAANGEIFDERGLAARRLGEGIGSESTAAGLAQLLAAMEKAGQIRREIRGKRTYRIALGPNADAALVAASGGQGPSTAAAPSPAAQGPATVPTGSIPAVAAAAASVASMIPPNAEVDYDELALALLRRVARAMSDPNTADLAASSLGTARAQRRIVTLERRLSEMERSLARANAETVRIGGENADLQARLEAASQTIDNLMGQLNQRRPGPSARQRLDAGDIAVLDQLTRPNPRRLEDSQAG
jgi:hypothetical protein